MMGAILTLLLYGKITTTKQIVRIEIIQSSESGVNNDFREYLIGFYR